MRFVLTNITVNNRIFLYFRLFKCKTKDGLTKVKNHQYAYMFNACLLCVA